MQENSVFSLLLVKFGELPEPAPLREQKWVSREVAWGWGCCPWGSPEQARCSSPQGKQLQTYAGGCCWRRGSVCIPWGWLTARVAPGLSIGPRA